MVFWFFQWVKKGCVREKWVNVVSNLGVSFLDDNSGKRDVSNYDNHPSNYYYKTAHNGQKQAFS